MARRARRIGPSTIVSIARRASSSVTSSIAPLAGTPALFTSPKGLSSSMTALHCRASVTSSVTVRTLTWAARAARVTLLAFEGLRTPPTGVKPRRASSIRVASPIPVPAPVTSTVRSRPVMGTHNLTSRRMRLWNPVGVREFAALARDPVFRGRGIPQGDGRAVLLIPGFLSGDWSMLIMSNWLQRIGYTPHMSGITLNIQHSEHMIAGLRKRLAAVRAESDGRVSLVGHSRGGVLAKVLSSRMPDAVEQVIGLGSPFANQFDVAALTNVAVGVIRTAGGWRSSCAKRPSAWQLPQARHPRDLRLGWPQRTGRQPRGLPFAGPPACETAPSGGVMSSARAAFAPAWPPPRGNRPPPAR